MTRTRRLSSFIITFAILACANAVPQQAHSQHTNHAAAPASGVQTPSVAFDARGRLWRVWIEGKRVLVGVSSDLGRSYAPPTPVTREPEDVDANGESRPKIAIGPDGEVFVSWTRSGARPYMGDIRFARSIDGGRTFAPPRTVNDDGRETGHRFDALTVGPDGTVYLMWIDKRDLDLATAADREYDGAALYFTLSRDRGRTFAPNRKIKDQICECCRIAHAFDADGRLVLVWRDLMSGSVRDHALVRVSADGTAGAAQRVTFDGWAIDACPHHGPSLSAAGDGVLHVAWFTGAGPLGPGAFYGRLSADGKLIDQPRRLGPPLPSTGHAVVLASGLALSEPGGTAGESNGRVLVAWKEARRPGGAAVMLIESLDGGRTFGAPTEVAHTVSASDHPFLVRHGDEVYLSWQSSTEGHRMFSFPASSPPRAPYRGAAEGTERPSSPRP